MESLAIFFKMHQFLLLEYNRQASLMVLPSFRLPRVSRVKWMLLNILNRPSKGALLVQCEKGNQYTEVPTNLPLASPNSPSSEKGGPDSHTPHDLVYRVYLKHSITYDKSEQQRKES